MRWSLLVMLSPLACGPAVLGDDPRDSASGGATEPAVDASTSTSAGESITGDDGSTSGSEREPRCGDGLVQPGEACDDGNGQNADGCSVQCRLSGEVAWSRVFAPGFAVALSSREGAVVGAVQQFEGSDPTVVIGGFDAEGGSNGEFFDVGGLSDLDIARDAVELLPEGLVALGYPVSDGTGVVRHFGVLDLATGTVEGYRSELSWVRTFGVAKGAEEIVVLRGTDEGEAIAEGFDAHATHLWTAANGRDALRAPPIARGAVLRRSGPGGVALALDPDDGLIAWRTSPYQGQLVPLAMTPEGARPAAFSDDVRAWMWTGEALLETDEDTHVVQTLPRSFDGELLWADAFGLVVAVGSDLVLYDDAGALRSTVVLPTNPGEALQPRFVRPDLEGAGLFVLADQGVLPNGSAGLVALHYVVR